MNNKFKISLIAFLFCLSIALRLPNRWLFDTTGSDAHAYEFLTFQILHDGYMSWILSPFSYFGMYPYSYASGPMAFNGILSLVSGLDLGPVILIYSLLNAFLGTFFAFFIGRLFFKVEILPPIIIALSFTLNHYFLVHTLWRFSTRAMFMSLLPFMLWSFLKTLKGPNRFKYIWLSTFAFFLLLTIHRMNTYSTFTLLVPLLIYYVTIFVVTSNKIKELFNHNSTKYYLTLFSLFLLITVIEFREVYISLGFPIRETWLFEGYNQRFIGEYLNIFRTYSERGLLFFLIFPGIIFLFSKQNKTNQDIYLIFIIFFQLLWILDAEYFFPIVSLTISILSGYGLKYLEISFDYRKEFFPIFVVTIFVISIAFTSFQRDVATRVQIERDWPSNYDGTEADDTSLWRSQYIRSDEMIISDSTEIHKLGANGKMALLEDNMIIWQWKNVSESLDVETLNLFQILFHQPEYHYGGKVADWTTGEQDIFGEKHEGYILWEIETRPSYEKLIEYYDLKWIFIINREDWATEYPFIESSESTSYNLFSNELFTILRYDS